MIRTVVTLTILSVIAGCTPRVPDSNPAVVQQVGSFDLPAPAPVAAVPLDSSGQAVSPSELSALGIGAGQSNAGAPMSALAPTAPATTGVSAANPLGISDENDFDAVASRQTIQSDAQRRAQLAAQRQEIAPTAVPQRPADTGPNIVQYALAAPNRKGQEWYSRSIFASQARFQRNCARYASPDAAQRDFLARGGPERNPGGLDPDGDGFACGWDPEPFRLAAQGR